MKWLKYKDGERVSTPIFMGFTPMAMDGDVKNRQLLTCGHKWEEFGPTVTKGEVKLSSERCSRCNGTRTRLVGPESHLAQTVGVHAKDDYSDSESDHPWSSKHR